MLFAVSLLLVTAFARPVEAAPWWWAHFSRGNGVFDNSSPFERWMAFAINDCGASDTLYIHSYTWGTGQFDPINGLSNGNDVGLNNVAINIKNAGSPKNYVFTEGSVGPPQMLDTANVVNILITESPTFNTSHNKLIVIPGRRVVLGSANFTAGAYSNQPNNMLVIKSGFTSLINRYVAQMEEFRNGKTTNDTWGLYHDTTPTGPPYYLNAPNGDTVEIYFSPDDNDATQSIPDGTTPGTALAGSGGTLEGVVSRVINRATQSVFYGINLTNMDKDNFLPNPIQQLVNNNVALVEGWLDQDGSTGAVTRGALQADHTSRDTAGNPGFKFTDELHHKIFIVDQEIVITGSPNLTSTALANYYGNDENMVVAHDFRMARRYLQEYRRVMDTVAAENVGAADSFDTTKPAAPTNFTVTATDTAFYPAWTASGTTDVTRYFLFISTSNLDTRGIGDNLDNDADGYYDEDPVGDADGFPSGTAAPGAANDDDADGSSDEDPWAYPEVQVKGRASTGGTITSVNCGDALAPATNYYFVIVAVDTHGNESAIDTYGPVMLGSSTPDTRLAIRKNGDVPDTNARRGETGVVAASLWIRGASSSGADTLTIFAVRNLGTTDSLDLTVRLWRDENNDSRVGPADTMLAQLAYSTMTGRYQAAFSATDSRVRVDTPGGKTFLVTLDLFDTATLGETFQARVEALTCSAPRSESGPASAVTNAGAVTVVSANPVTVVKRGDYPSATVARGVTDSAVMTLRVGVSVANDTLRVATISNAGTMTSSDVAALRLYHDHGSDSLLTGADTFVAALRWNGSNWVADTISYPFAGTSIDLIVALSVSGSATGGNTFVAGVPANSFDGTNADTGPATSLSTPAVFSVATETSPNSSIVVNEFMPNPATGVPPDHDNDLSFDDADEEFIELYNNSDGSVDIGGWKIHDHAAGTCTIPVGVVLGPRQYLSVFIDGRFWRYDTTGRVTLETGTTTGVFGGLNNAAPGDNVCLRDTTHAIVDTTPYSGNSATNRTFQRLYDGASYWGWKAPTVGVNFDPSPFDSGAPNGRLALSVTPATILAGESATVTMTLRDADNATCTIFVSAVALSADTGSVTPASSQVFVLGARAESFTVTGILANCSVILRATYNTNTTGTAVLTVNRRPTVTVVVDLEARANEAGCTGTLANGVDTYVAVSNAGGTTTFANVNAGTYTLTLTEDHHLRKVLTGIVVAAADTTVSAGMLRAGDVNGDRRVNLFDAAIVKFYAWLGNGTLADIDGSGTVNNADIAWIRANFGRVGE